MHPKLNCTQNKGFTLFLILIGMVTMAACQHSLEGGGGGPVSLKSGSLVPTNFVAAVDSQNPTSQIDLSWQNNGTGTNGAYDSITLSSSTDGINFTVLTSTLAGSATTYNATGLSANVPYYFTVQGILAGQTYAVAAPASATTQGLPAPSGLLATTKSTSEIDLSWTAPQSGVYDGIQVYQSNDGGKTYSPVGSLLAGTASTYAVTGLAAATSYYFYVEGEKASVYSPASLGQEGTTFSGSTTVLNPPTGFLARGFSPYVLSLSWTNSDTYSSITVSTSPDNQTFTPQATALSGSATSVKISALADGTVLKPGTTYYFKLQATKGALTSAFSSVASAMTFAVALDFDHRGYTPFCIYRPGQSYWGVLGDSFPGPTPNGFGWSNVDVPVPADYQGLGSYQYAVYRPNPSGASNWFILGGAPSVVAFGWVGDIPVPADYDGVGHAQIAVFRPSTAEWYIWGHSNPIQFGAANSDVPIPGDYLGLGHAQIAVYRPASGGNPSYWFVNGASASPAGSVGSAGDMPVPGDYDGVGHWQFAVFHPPAAQWLVAGDAPISFGATTDVPVPGYYNGIHQFQIAVYRPTTSEWFVAGSSGPVQFGGDGAEMPLAALSPATYGGTLYIVNNDTIANYGNSVYNFNLANLLTHGLLK